MNQERSNGQWDHPQAYGEYTSSSQYAEPYSSQYSSSYSDPYDSSREQRSGQMETSINMTMAERNVSIAAGILLLAFALIRRGWLGLGSGAAGISLIYQGGTGVSPVLKLMNITHSTHNPDAAISVPHEQGKHLSASVTINRTAGEIYDFWRDFANLPRFLPSIKSIEVQNDIRSHWVVNGPAGIKVEWDAEIVNDVPDSVIGWRSLENPWVTHAGSVRFTAAPADQGTEVRVEMEYLPVGGAAAVSLASLLGQAPEQQVTESLHRLKQLLETGTIPGIDGQSSGRNDAGRTDADQAETGI